MKYLYSISGELNELPPEPGWYNVKCGYSGDIFTANYQGTNEDGSPGAWRNDEGQTIVFGTRPRIGDAWGEFLWGPVKGLTRRVPIEDSAMHACITYVIHGDADFEGLNPALVKYFKEKVDALRRVSVM